LFRPFYLVDGFIYYQEKLKTADLTINLLLDINQGVIPVEEGEEKLKKLHEQMVEHNKRIESLNVKP